jgi:hypothetical protein
MSMLMFFIPHFVTDVLWFDDDDELITVGEWVDSRSITLPLLEGMPMPTNFKVIKYITWFGAMYCYKITCQGHINE